MCERTKTFGWHGELNKGELAPQANALSSNHGLLGNQFSLTRSVRTYSFQGFTDALKAHEVAVAMKFVLLATLARVDCTSTFGSRIKRVFLGSVAVHLSKRHFLDRTLNISIERKLGAPRFEPGAAG